MSGSFVGRKAELKKLDELLKGPCRYITIHGFGGIGKTALALQAANNFHSGRVLGLSLAGIPKPTQVFAKIARFFHINTKNYPDPDDLEFEVLGALENEERILLYLDNMENIKHAISDGNSSDKENAKTLLRFFGRLPENVKILATSRIALGWPSETLFTLGGLAPEDSIQVFRQWISHRSQDVDIENI